MNNEKLPIYQCFLFELKDERFDNVILVDITEEGQKTTAENCGTYWLIVDWETLQIEDVAHWFCGSSYRLEKSLVDTLHAQPLK